MAKGHDTHLTPFGSAWEARYGGAPPYARMAPALTPLIKAHGTDAVLAAWTAYLATEDAKYASPQAFAGKYGIYAGTAAAKATPAQLTKWAVAEWLYDGDKDDPVRRAIANGLVRLGNGLTKPLTTADVAPYGDELAGMAPEAIERAFAALKASGGAWWPSPAAVAQAAKPSPHLLKIQGVAAADKVGSAFWYPKGQAFDPEYVDLALGEAAGLAFRSVSCYRLYRTWDDENPYAAANKREFVRAYIELVQEGRAAAPPERLALTGKECEAAVNKQLKART